MNSAEPKARFKTPLSKDLTRIGVYVAITAIWLYITAHLVWAALEAL